MTLRNYVRDQWHLPETGLTALRSATTGEVVAQASTQGLDFASVLRHAREVGGPQLRALTFHERAAMLKALARYLTERKDEFYSVSFATGATRRDSWIDIEGGFGTLFVYASKGTRELPNARVYADGPPEIISKQGTFLGQHICLPLDGVAVHINAFNFPVWGMLEKLAPTLLAGVPAVIKPATATSYLAARVFEAIIASGILPPGSVQLLCGSVGDLFDHLTGQDVVSFTGSASTALRLKTHPTVVAHAVRFIAETDSLNSCILGPDAVPGTDEFDLFVKEVVREMTAKAGQKCTAIRRALVPQALTAEVVTALQAALARVTIGDPALDGVHMGPLASLDQRREVLARVDELRQEADVVSGDMATLAPRGADATTGAFVPPFLLLCRDAERARAVHAVEAFGPVCTVIPYADLDEAITLTRRGEGSLAGSLFTRDDEVAARLVMGLGPYHGRLLVVNRDCARESTGHGSPLPHLVHGGPGRAGGGEELGGIRGVLHYMQRTAIQGSPQTLTAITGRFVKGATEHDPGTHPFRKTFHDLRIGDTLWSAERTVTIDDIERFADLSGDRFYAHMDQALASRNPFFPQGRVAHGYFLISAAAGLFVDPVFGPVMANYGIDHLRFLSPASPGDVIRVRVTCKEKTLRAGKGYGEVRWDTEIVNQRGETVASYDVLTMVSEHPTPEGPVTPDR